MKKLVLTMIVILATITANAQEFKYSGQLRTRGYMHTVESAFKLNADNQVMHRVADIRFRPQFEYKVNEQLKTVLRLEIGDVVYGNKASGGEEKTDGINLETKSLYLDYLATPDHLIRVGLQGYADPMSLVVDNDFAGISYQGKFDVLSLKAAYLVSVDGGESKLNDKDYSFGKSNLGLDVAYSVDKNLKFGLNTLVQFDTNTLDTLKTVTNSTGMWISPYANLKMMDNKLNLDAEFAYFSRSGKRDEVIAGAKKDDPKDESGLALFLKSAYKATEEFTLGVNFLYASGTDKTDPEYFQQTSNSKLQDLATGLEILGTGSNDGVNLSPALKTAKSGVLLPVLHLNYQMDKNLAFGGAFGYAMSAADYINEKNEKNSSLGMEIDLNSTITVAEKLSLKPFAAFLMPSEGFQVLNKDKKYEAAPMQMEIGLTAEIKF